MRDELRLEMHLARMEAKERWRELEPRLSQVSRKAVDEISGKLRDLRTSLDELRRENRG